MFSKKHKIPTVCDSYLNMYNACNIGCHFCKFNQCIKTVELTNIQYSEYRNKTVLVCYSVDPYPLGYDKDIVPKVIQKLHVQGCKIVFLTRRADCLLKDINLFCETDYIGVSISEESDKNSSLTDIENLFVSAKKNNTKTWISLEPIATLEFALNIINHFKDKVDFIRIGKNDLDDSQKNWREIKTKIDQLQYEFVFVKE